MTSSTDQKGEDHWNSTQYQKAASFVPKLATKIVNWLDVSADDVILDIGCGDGLLNFQFAETLAKGNGRVHGVDSSDAMIKTAQDDAAKAGVEKICTFEVLDATKIGSRPELANATYDKAFSNAAMHWILRPATRRDDFFKGVHAALKPGGIFSFEMGGQGNVAEMRSTFLAVLAPRIGLEAARAADPWFFPDEIWMSNALTKHGFEVINIEREYRPTRADASGIAGWVKLMGKQFFDAVERKVGKEERDKCESEAVDILKTVCESQVEDGGDWIGYVRLRALAKKI